MLLKYREAIELTKWLVWQMQATNVKNVPKDTLEELKAIQERLNHLLSPLPGHLRKSYLEKIEVPLKSLDKLTEDSVDKTMSTE